MKIEEYIKINARNLEYQVFVAPDIPSKKLNNCIKYIANSVEPEYILMLGDSTISNNANAGFVFTGEQLFFSNSKGHSVSLYLSEIAGANYMKKSVARNDNHFAAGDKIEIKMRDGSIQCMELCMNGFDCAVMENLINGVVDLVNNGEVPHASKQNIALSELSDDIKLIYLKILCNYAYINDSVIDSTEYSVIQNIVVRIEISPKFRNELREYMADIERKEKTGNLLYTLHNSLEYGSFDIVRYSLMQDILLLHTVTSPDKPWNEDGFVGSLMKNLCLYPKQIELMEYAVSLNRKMVSDDADITGLQKQSKELVERALIIGIPLMTLYCSGSAYSIDTYKKIFNGKEKAQLSIDKQRELMLQTVIKNTQDTVNNLVEDMNSISKQLVHEIQKGFQSNAKIEKLSALLMRLTKGAEVTVAKSEIAEQRALLLKIPFTLDMTRLEQIRKSKACEIEYRNIMNYYIHDENTNRVTLMNGIKTNELRKLAYIFEEINY